MDRTGSINNNSKIALANIYLINNIDVYIHDTSDNYYFAKIKAVTDEKITIECFGPKQREGQTIDLFWPEVLQIARKS